VKRLRASLFFSLCAVVVVSSLLLGGGTRAGFLSDTLLELLAIPLLMVALWRLRGQSWPSEVWWGAAFCLALALVPALQLVPLPPTVWTALPGRAQIAAAFALIGQPLPWWPLSVTPGATLLAALSLVVPISVFLGTALLPFRERRWLSLIVVAVALMSVFLGLAQVAQGPSSPLRFFAFTNPNEAVGFFANRNHFAALLYSVMMFAAAWAISGPEGLGLPERREKRDGGSLVGPIVGFTLLVLVLAAVAATRSRAGFVLTFVALLAVAALMVRNRNRQDSSRRLSPRFLLGACLVALVCVGQLALYRVFERFAVDNVDNARVLFARLTVKAAMQHMPFGSGVGSFVSVYPRFEAPTDLLARTVANRAHNDVLEVWLETGVVGFLLMGAFALWFLRRAFGLWKRGVAEGEDIDSNLARAAVVVVGLLAAHSCLDYPLRTGALMALMAMSCAFLVAPPAEPEKKEGAIRDAAAPAASPRATVGAGAFARPPQARPTREPPGKPASAPGVKTPVGLPLGDDSLWPEEWRRRPSSAAETPASPRPEPKKK